MIINIEFIIINVYENQFSLKAIVISAIISSIIQIILNKIFK